MCRSKIAKYLRQSFQIINNQDCRSDIAISNQNCRSEEYSNARVNTSDCTHSPTLCALPSHHRLQCSSRLEHLPLYDLVHFSLAGGTFNASRCEARGNFKCASQYLGLYSFSHSLRSTISPSTSMQLKIGASSAV